MLHTKVMLWVHNSWLVVVNVYLGGILSGCNDCMLLLGSKIQLVT